MNEKVKQSNEKFKSLKRENPQKLQELKKLEEQEKQRYDQEI